MSLLPADERKWRCKVIKDGVGGQFWQVFRDSLAYMAHAKLLEMEQHLAKGRPRKAERCAIEKQIIERIMDEPDWILRENDSLFENVAVKAQSIKAYFQSRLRGFKSADDAIRESITGTGGGK